MATDLAVRRRQLWQRLRARGITPARVRRARNVFEHIRLVRGCWLLDFTPKGLPPPTTAQPGSAEKIAVLRARLEAGLELHHPDDCRMAAKTRRRPKIVKLLTSRKRAF